MQGNPMNILMQLMAGGGNPQQMLQNMIRQNPQVNAIFNQQKQSGMTMEQFVRQYAKQNNIDINQMVDFLKQRGMRL